MEEGVCYNLERVDVLDEHGKTILVVDKRTNKKYIEKYVSREQLVIYQVLMGMNSLYLPKVYEIKEEGGLFGNDWVMILEEFVEGETISEKLNRTGIIGQKEVINYILQLCDGLSEVHDRGIVHRDIKPFNIIIANNGRVRIEDFGIARIIKRVNNKDTVLMGTPGYASPEQFGFAQSDVRSDIYSIGILINEMLTGHTPENGICRNSLKYIVRKCIDMNPQYRYPNLKKLKQDLRRIQNHTYFWYKNRKIVLVFFTFSCIAGVVLTTLYRNQKDIQNKKLLLQEATTTNQVNEIGKNNNKEQQSTEKTINIVPTMYYAVNQSEQDAEGEYYSDGEGTLVFGSDTPLYEEHDVGLEGFKYITYTTPESGLNFVLENTNDSDISNPAIFFEFTNLMLWGQDDDNESISYSNHVQGFGGYGTLKWEPPKGYRLRPGEKSDLVMLNMRESVLYDDGKDVSVKITIVADNCKSRSFVLPIKLRTY